VWNKEDDNRNDVKIKKVENMKKILRMFMEE
jgi:hypothetical protein